MMTRTLIAPHLQTIFFVAACDLSVMNEIGAPSLRPGDAEYAKEVLGCGL